MLSTGGLPMLAGLRSHGDAPALITPQRTLSYTELADEVDAAIPRFGGGRRLVGIGMAADITSVVHYLAALAGGHVVLLAAPCALAEVASEVAPSVMAVGSEISVDADRGHDLHPDLALLLSTSGSTGSTKLVRLSYRNLHSNASAIAQYLAIRPTDVALTTLPLHYCYGLSVLHSHLLAGAAVRLTNASVADEGFASQLSAVTTLPGVPHTFDLLERTGAALPPSLRVVTAAGGRMAPDRVRAWAQRGQAQGFDFFVMYGQTEATARMLYLPPDLAASHPSSVGIPIPGGSVRIDDGELVYTGDNVMMGYATGPDDLSCGPQVTELRTGDLARINDAGLVEIVGRKSRFAKIFGLRVDLGGVESRLAQDGRPVWCMEADGCLLAACLDDPDAVRPLLCRAANLPVSAVVVHQVAEVPRTSSGKPDYPALQRQVQPPAPVPTDSAVELYAAVLGRTPESIRPQDTFVSLGGDSLSYVAAAAALERLLGTLPSDWHLTAVADLVPGGRRSRWVRDMDTTVVLRAIAILTVVASHVGVLDVRGGAHLLIAVAGWNFARFRLGSADRRTELAGALGSLARLVVPIALYLAAVAALTAEYSASLVFGVNLFGPPEGVPEWRYWYVEALVFVLLAAIAAIGLGHRVQRRWPYGFALAALGAGLLARWVFAAEDGPNEWGTPVVVAWLFAAGWALAAAGTARRRLPVLALVGVGLIGYFDNPWRAAFVLIGVVIFAFAPSLPVPTLLSPVVGALAGASLWIYLTHWQTYPPLAEWGWGAVLVAVVVGLAAAQAEGRLWRAWRVWRGPRGNGRAGLAGRPLPNGPALPAPATA